MKNLKFLGFLVLAFSLLLGFTATAFADEWTESSIDVSELIIYANGNPVWYGDCYDTGDGFSCYTYQMAVPALERDGTLSIKAVFKAADDVSDVKVRAWINGYREEIEDRTGEFDIFDGMQYSKTLLLTIPEDIDAKDDFTLHVQIEAKTNLHGIDEAVMDTSTQRIANKLKILSTNFWSQNAGNAFVSGTTLYTDVVVKNIGNHLAEDTFVRVSIPELKLERTVYIGDIGSYDDQYEDAVKTIVSLKLPEETAAGNYKVIVEAYNSDLKTEATQTIAIDGAEQSNGTDGNESDETDATQSFNWENLLMIISIVLAAAIIVLLVLMLVKQKSCVCEEKPETETEGYY